MWPPVGSPCIELKTGFDNDPKKKKKKKRKNRKRESISIAISAYLRWNWIQRPYIFRIVKSCRFGSSWRYRTPPTPDWIATVYLWQCLDWPSCASSQQWIAEPFSTLPFYPLQIHLLKLNIILIQTRTHLWEILFKYLKWEYTGWPVLFVATSVPCPLQRI